MIVTPRNREKTRRRSGTGSRSTSPSTSAPRSTSSLLQRAEPPRPRHGSRPCSRSPHRASVGSGGRGKRTGIGRYPLRLCDFGGPVSRLARGHDILTETGKAPASTKSVQSLGALSRPRRRERQVIGPSRRAGDGPQPVDGPHELCTNPSSGALGPPRGRFTFPGRRSNPLRASSCAGTQRGRPHPQGLRLIQEGLARETTARCASSTSRPVVCTVDVPLS